MLKNFGRGFESQDFPVAVIETSGDGVQSRLGDARHVHALGQVLSRDQAVGVLVAGPLLGAARVGEVDLDRQPPGQFLVPRHVLPLVVGQRLTYTRREASELSGAGLQGGIGAGAVHPRQSTPPGCRCPAACT